MKYNIKNVLKPKEIVNQHFKDFIPMLRP